MLLPFLLRSRRFFLLRFCRRGLLGLGLGLFLFFFCGFRLFLFLFWPFLLLWRFLAFSTDEGDLVADVYLAAFLDVNFRERPVFRRFPFHRRLVGFDLGKHFAGGNLVSLLFLPRDQSALGHRVTELRHLDFRHKQRSSVISNEWRVFSRVANLFHRCEEFFRGWEYGVLEPLIVGHWNIFL